MVIYLLNANNDQSVQHASVAWLVIMVIYLLNANND